MAQQQQQPAVVIIARHGMRLDASDASWHLSTPTPYDPPLTYGGWSQCRTLGVRIANILHAREQEADDVNGGQKRKRRRIKHKVVIHSSPFQRCLQTSVAIAAGMAQYSPTIETAGKNRASPGMPPVSEPKQDFKHAIARKALHEHKRYRRSTLRVDAFLGEWLNPEYFSDITPPPPSAMMLATAKGELMENEAVEVFTPATSQQKSSGSSLWGSTNGLPNPSRESSFDDMSHVEEALPTSSRSRRRDRASTQSSAGSNDRPRSPFRPGGALQPLTSTVPKPETSIYNPPQPQYAVSPSDQIPRGYVAHARNACTNIDYQWDSGRPPQSWGDGGEFGEEWSSMHKRLRRGLNHLIQWYSQEKTDGAGESEHQFNRPDRSNTSSGDEEEEEQEDIVVVLVTHGAGCNALIGALTGQPVLLDVGMASLTVAVRRDDAPQITTYASSNAPTPRRSPSPEQQTGMGGARRASLDLGLSSVYEMKLVASTEHLRPGGAGAASPSMRPVDSTEYRRQRFGTNLEPPRNNTSAALGSIRRPSAVAANISGPGSDNRSNSMPPDDRFQASRPVSAGLWTPPVSRASPSLVPQNPGTHTGSSQPGDDMVLDFSNSPPDSRPSTAAGVKEPSPLSETATPEELESPGEQQVDGVAGEGDTVGELNPGPRRGSGGLWGDGKVRKGRQTPKRRWTVDQE